MGYRVINARGQHDPHAKAESHRVDESGRLWLYDADGGFVVAYGTGRWESFGVTEKPAERITLTEPTPAAVTGVYRGEPGIMINAGEPKFAEGGFL